MSSSLDPESRPDRIPGGDDAGQPKPTVAVAVPTARLWTWAVGAGLAAGLASWLVGEELLIAYRAELTPKVRAIPVPKDLLDAIAAEKFVATLTFAAQGALLGLALGVAGGGARRSAVAAGWAGLAGLILGAVAACAAAFGLLPIYYAHHDPLDDSLILPMLTHAGVASAAGLAGGMALGLGLGGGWGRVGRTLLGGLLGGAGGAILYEIVAALASPGGRTGSPVSAMPGTRLFLLLAVALMTAAVASGMAQAPAPRSRSVPPAG